MNTHECDEYTLNSFTKHGLGFYHSVVHKHICVSKFTGTKISKKGRVICPQRRWEWLRRDRATAKRVEQFLKVSNFASFVEKEPLNEAGDIYPISAENVKFALRWAAKRRQAMFPNSVSNSNRNESKPFFGFENQSIVDECQRDSVPI